MLNALSYSRRLHFRARSRVSASDCTTQPVLQCTPVLFHLLGSQERSKALQPCSLSTSPTLNYGKKRDARKVAVDGVETRDVDRDIKDSKSRNRPSSGLLFLPLPFFISFHSFFSLFSRFFSPRVRSRLRSPLFHPPQFHRLSQSSHSLLSPFSAASASLSTPVFRSFSTLNTPYPISLQHQLAMSRRMSSSSFSATSDKEVPFSVEQKCVSTDGTDASEESRPSFSYLVRHKSSSSAVALSRSSSLSLEGSREPITRRESTAGITSKDRPNFLFQEGTLRARPSSVAMYLSAMQEELWMDDNFLERSHHYIQWLFPISEGAGMNTAAFPLTPEEAAAIAQSPSARFGIFSSFLMMLRFWGFRMDFTTLYSTDTKTSSWASLHASSYSLPLAGNRLSAVFPSIVPVILPSTNSKDTLERFENWTASHNSLRISRVLRCLSETGNHSLALPFISALIAREFIASTSPHTAPSYSSSSSAASMGSLQNYWIQALHPVLAKPLQALFVPGAERQMVTQAVKNAVAECGDNALTHDIAYIATLRVVSRIISDSSAVHPTLFTLGIPSPSAKTNATLTAGLQSPTAGPALIAEYFTTLTKPSIGGEKDREIRTRDPHSFGHSTATLTQALEKASVLSSSPFILHAVSNATGATPSTFPFSPPDFTRLRDEDYLSAIERGMTQQLAAVEEIVSCPDAPTLENTIIPLELSSPLLDAAHSVFSALVSASTSDALQALNSKISSLLSAHSDAIRLDQRLFARVSAINDERIAGKLTGLTSEDERVIERTYAGLVRAGAALSPQQREKLQALNLEESALMTSFSDRLLAATKAGALVIPASEAKEKLAGLSPAEIMSAKEVAEARGISDAYVLTLSNTTLHPLLGSLSHRPTRLALQKASANRCCSGGPFDTRDLVARLSTLRAQKAFLFGKPSYAALLLQHQMCGSEERARELLARTLPPALRRAKREHAKLQTMADAAVGSPAPVVEAADWDFYANQVRKAEYDFDSSEMKPYFELDRVLREGVFYVARKLYGVEFRPLQTASTYNPDVRVYEVVEHEGEGEKEYVRAVFYLDPYARDNKQGGAWCTSFVEQNGLTKARPIICNVENFTKPAAGEPCLLDWEDIITLFHEAGHGFHGIFSDTKYPSLSGLNVPSDFVELPSQVYENWAMHPEVLSNFARHYESGEPMPQELMQKLKRSETFNKGYSTVEYLQASLLDLAWHSLPAQEGSEFIVTPDNVEVFEAKALAEAGFDIPAVPVRYKSTIFAHVFCSMYAAGYYAYLWSEWLDQDAFVWFMENGGLTRSAGEHFRKTILSIGNTKDVAQAYRDFRGAEPDITPLLRKRGLLDEQQV